MNTTSEVTMAFIKNLVKILNEQNRRWRHQTQIFWDGASYHKSPETRKLLSDLQVPMMISGAHSYDVAPCEKWFALFKRVNINPRRVKTGKT